MFGSRFKPKIFIAQSFCLIPTTSTRSTVDSVVLHKVSGVVFFGDYTTIFVTPDSTLDNSHDGFGQERNRG